MNPSYDAAHDVIVAGAGIFGSWIAHTLHRAGAQVLLLDPHGPGNDRASSSDRTRIIRMSYGPDEIYTRSAIRSLELWKRYFPEMFYQTGVLVTAKYDDPYLIATHDVLTRNRVNHEWLDSAALYGRFSPILLDRDAAGVYEPDSGILFARHAVQSVASHSGAALETARAIRMKDRRTLETSLGDRTAERFVFACGPWLPQIFPDIIGDRIRPTRQEVFYFTVGVPSTLPAWIGFRDGAYTVPWPDSSTLKVGIDSHGPAFDPENGSRSTTPEGLAAARTILEHFFAQGDAQLVSSRVCQYENTSNGDFLIDRHPDFDNVWIAGGGSGHGFKHGPFVGEYVASLINGTLEPEPRFSLVSKTTAAQRSVY